MAKIENRQKLPPEPTQDALERMKRACKRGTGCHLTAEMVRNLGNGLLGQMWEEEDPRLASHSEEPRP